MSFSGSLIPVMQIMLITAFALKLIVSPTLISFLSLGFIIYLLPPLLWRISRILVPVSMGQSSLDEDAEFFNGWVMSNQLQKIYDGFPPFEIILKCIPGFYSAWLRLWGAEIGSSIQWSLLGRVIDRPFIHIGDRCVIGNQAKLLAHQVKITNKKTYLILSELKVESDVILLNNLTL